MPMATGKIRAVTTVAVASQFLALQRAKNDPNANISGEHVKNNRGDLWPCLNLMRGVGF